MKRGERSTGRSALRVLPRKPVLLPEIMNYLKKRGLDEAQSLTAVAGIMVALAAASLLAPIYIQLPSAATLLLISYDYLLMQKQRSKNKADSKLSNSGERDEDKP